MKIDRGFWFFVVGTTMLSLVLGLGAHALALPPPSFTRPILWGMAIVTIIIFLLLKKVKSNVPAGKNFTLITYYMLSIFAKFILAGISVFLILRLDVPGSRANIIFFMVCYATFTVVEIGGLLLVRANETH